MAVNPQSVVNQSVPLASTISKPGTIALCEAAAFIDTNSGSMNLQAQRPSGGLANSTTPNLVPKKTSMTQTATLHSPSNPARTGRSFINIEDILARVGDKGVDAPGPSTTSRSILQQGPSALLQKACGVTTSSVVLPAFSTSQLSPPPGVHPLTSFGNLTPACSKQTAFTSVVNQKPIPSVFESNQNAPQPAASTATANSSNIGPLLQSLGIANPNMFLANPGAVCGIPLPITSGLFPPVSSLYSNGHLAGNHYPPSTQALVAATNDSLVSRTNGPSPPKRPRLE